MKQFKMLLAILLFAISFTSFAQSKVAHVKTQEIIALMPAAKAANAEIEGMSESYGKEIEAMEKDVVEKQNRYAAEQDTVSDEMNQMRGAELQEREIYDLMGIYFHDHPNMKRLLLWENFDGHPLRKDFVN